jgi:hypothetical protein
LEKFGKIPEKQISMPDGVAGDILKLDGEAMGHYRARTLEI